MRNRGRGRGDGGSGQARGRLLSFARWLTGHHKLVIALWLLAVLAATPLAGRLPSVLTRQGASKVVPGTQSALADGLVTRAFPQRSGREALIVVTARDVNDLRVKQLLAVLDAAIRQLIAGGQVEQTSSAYTLYRDAALAYLRQARAPRAGAAAPGDGALRSLAGDFAVRADWRHFPIPVPGQAAQRLISPRGDETLVSVSFRRPGDADGDADVGRLRGIVASLLGNLALRGTVHANVTGETALVQDTYAQAEADDALMEQVAFLVIGLVLVLFFRALLPAIITIGSIGLAMNVSRAGLYALGRQVTLTQFTVTIMTFVMLGAGVDYSMLLSSRYRQERIAGRPVREAVVQATAHAGESVLLAGIAVVVAFGATLLSPVDWIPPLGYGGLIGIPIILLAAVTLTPSLLVLLGDRFFWLGWKPLTDLENSAGLARYLRGVSAVARRCKLTVVVLFAAATVPFAWVAATHSLTADPVALSADTDARRGFEAIARGWGASAMFPTVVTGRLDRRFRDGSGLTPAGFKAVEGVVAPIAAVDGVARVDAVTRPFGSVASRAQVDAMPAELRRDFIADDGTLRVVVTLRGDPFSPGAREVVARVGDVLDEHAATVGRLLLGGTTRVDEQYDAALRSSFWRMIVLVSVGVLVLLLLALRSLLVPVRLIVTIMMSNVWAIAITLLVFQGWRHQPVINDLPIFLVILMMGLGMDYEIFLVTRVRDLVRHGASNEEATMAAVVDTGRVINAAGLVMTGSLGTMALSSTLMLRQYGVGLGTAVLLDATLVRMLLVPATLLLLGRYNWWLPRWVTPFRRITAA